MRERGPWSVCPGVNDGRQSDQLTAPLLRAPSLLRPPNGPRSEAWSSRRGYRDASRPLLSVRKPSRSEPGPGGVRGGLSGAPGGACRLVCGSIACSTGKGWLAFLCLLRMIGVRAGGEAIPALVRGDCNGALALGSSGYAVA